MENTKYIGIRVPEEKHRAFRLFLASNRISTQELFENLVDTFIRFNTGKMDKHEIEYIEKTIVKSRS